MAVVVSRVGGVEMLLFMIKFRRRQLACYESLLIRGIILRLWPQIVKGLLLWAQKYRRLLRMLHIFAHLVVLLVVHVIIVEAHHRVMVLVWRLERWTRDASLILKLTVRIHFRPLK